MTTATTEAEAWASFWDVWLPGLADAHLRAPPDIEMTEHETPLAA